MMKHEIEDILMSFWERTKPIDVKVMRNALVPIMTK